MDQYTGAKWLIHGTKHMKDNQWKVWNTLQIIPVEKPDTMEVIGKTFNPISSNKVRGQIALVILINAIFPVVGNSLPFFQYCSKLY